MFAPFLLEFYLNDKVSTEIQGLSSTDRNFQGLLRTFKARANPVLNTDTSLERTLSMAPSGREGLTIYKKW